MKVPRWCRVMTLHVTLQFCIRVEGEPTVTTFIYFIMTMTATTTERLRTLSTSIYYACGVVGWWGYLLIRRVPMAMATIVHYVHYNRLRVPFRLRSGVTRRNNNIQ